MIIAIESVGAGASRAKPKVFLRCLAHRHLIKPRRRSSSSILHLLLTAFTLATILISRSYTFHHRVHHTRITFRNTPHRYYRLLSQTKLRYHLETRFQAFDHLFHTLSSHKEQTELHLPTHTREYFLPPLPTSLPLCQAALPARAIIISQHSSKTSTPFVNNRDRSYGHSSSQRLFLLTRLFPSKHIKQDARIPLH